MIITLAFVLVFVAWHRLITMQTRRTKPWPESFVFERRGPGQMLPAWYFGYSHWDMQTDCYIYAIMPFNWLTRCYRWARWRWDSFRGKPPVYQIVKTIYLHDMLRQQYDRGLECGQQIRASEAYQRGYDEALAFFAKKIKSSSTKVYYRLPTETEWTYLGDSKPGV